MIEILALLEQKTRGNLTAEERQILEQVLYELRMRFVDATRRRQADHRAITTSSVISRQSSVTVTSHQSSVASHQSLVESTVRIQPVQSATSIQQSAIL